MTIKLSKCLGIHDSVQDIKKCDDCSKYIDSMSTKPAGSVQLYYFEDLKEEAKEKAREWYRAGNDYQTLEEVIKYTIKEGLEELGYTIESDIEVRYSLSHSQGDGVSFSVTMSKDGARYFTTTSGHYRHEMMMDMTCEDLEDFDNVEVSKEQLEEVRDVARKAEKAGYAQIDFEDSDEHVDDIISVNEYTFTKEGKRLNPDD